MSIPACVPESLLDEPVEGQIYRLTAPQIQKITWHMHRAPTLASDAGNNFGVNALLGFFGRFS